MMQKVRGCVSAFLGFTGLFHFSFSFPLRYFLYRAWLLFRRPYLGGKMVCFGLSSVLGGMDGVVLVLLGWASCWASGRPDLHG